MNENEHLAYAFKAMKETGVLNGLDEELHRLVRAVIIEMVLKVRLA